MEIKKRGRKPITGTAMTQSERYQRYKSKKKNLGDPTSYEMRAITYAALKEAWIDVTYLTTVSLYNAVRKEAMKRGLDPDVAEIKFKEAMTQ